MTVQQVLELIKEIECHKSYRQTIIKGNNWSADLDLHMDAIKNANNRIRDLKRLVNSARIKIPEELIDDKKNKTEVK
jgi:hypothetical protein